MDVALIILDFLVLIGVVVIGLLVRSFLPSYAKQKGKNLATKEDISEITSKVEEVRSQHTAQLERLKIDLGVLAKKMTYFWMKKCEYITSCKKDLLLLNDIVRVH